MKFNNLELIFCNLSSNMVPMHWARSNHEGRLAPSTVQKQVVEWTVLVQQRFGSRAGFNARRTGRVSTGAAIHFTREAECSAIAKMLKPSGGRGRARP